MIKLRAIVGFLTILSGITGLLSYILVAGAVNFNFDFFSDSSLIFETQGVSSSMLRWSMITDVFGYYLLLLPVLFFIHHWLKERSNWRDLITFCGAAYIFAGALGASILGAAWPALLENYATASTDHQEIIKITFDSLALIVVNGIWNIFDAFMFGVWFISIGIFIKREHKLWGWFTIIVGIISILDFAGNIFSVKMLADSALNLYLVMAPAWAIGFGWAIRRSTFLK
jgi:hypothetical protein